MKKTHSDNKQKIQKHVLLFLHKLVLLAGSQFVYLTSCESYVNTIFQIVQEVKLYSENKEFHVIADSIKTTLVQQMINEVIAYSSLLYQDPVEVRSPPALLTLDPCEVAHEVTLITFEVFRNIKSVHIFADVQFWGVSVHQVSTKLASWMKREVCCAVSAEKQLQTVALIMSIAEEGRKMRDFSTAMTLFLLIEQQFAELRETKEIMNIPEMRKILKNFRQLNSGKNNETLRKETAKSLPCIPYSALLIHDLHAHRQQQQSAYSFRHNRVVLSVVQNMAKIARTVREHQSVPYSLSSNYCLHHLALTKSH